MSKRKKKRKTTTTTTTNKLHCPLASNSWNEIALYIYNIPVYIYISVYTHSPRIFKKSNNIKKKIQNQFDKNKFVILKKTEKKGRRGGEEEFYFIFF